ARDWESKGIRSALDAYQSIMDYRTQRKKESQQAKSKYNFKERQGERRPSWMEEHKSKQDDYKEKKTGQEDSKKQSESNQKTAKDDPEIQKMIQEFRK